MLDDTLSGQKFSRHERQACKVPAEPLVLGQEEWTAPGSYMGFSNNSTDPMSSTDMLTTLLPEWPAWAVNLLLAMTGALAVTLLMNYFYTPDDEKASAKENIMLKSTNKTHEDLHSEFNSFRKSYLSVYLVIMLADWMQGTHMYTLYLSYNVNISALFLTGFLSGAIFAPFLGSLVDKFGRKRSCIVYCVLEIIINWLEHYSSFEILLLGRVLGGISTNLLFSAFESWMATEHRKKGFPDEWMARTYSEVRRIGLE